MHLGAGRVKEVRAQALRWELEGMKMRDNETIDDFTGKIITIVNHLRSLGEEVIESYVVKKILRAVSSKFLQIASTIEEFGDLTTKTIEDVVGSLKAHEERLKGHESREDDHVLLVRRDWRNQKHGHDEASTERPKGRGGWRGSAPNRGGGREFGGGPRNFRSNNGYKRPDLSKIRCYSCNEFGHYASDCKGKKKDVHEEANILEYTDDEPALLVVEESETPISCDLLLKGSEEAEADRLTVEKAKFEAEWEDIDVRREELIKEAEYITRQKEAFSLYLKDERDNIREERDALRNQHKNDVEALNREREEFMNKMVEEHSEWHRKIQRERADLVLSFEMQKRELEYCIESKREEFSNSSREREKVFEQDIKLEKERIQPLKESAEKELEHVQVELKGLDAEKLETKIGPQKTGEEWVELKVSVLKQKVVTRDDELDVQNGVSPVSNNEDGYNSSVERQNGSTSSGKLKLDSSKRRRKDVTKRKNSKLFVS